MRIFFSARDYLNYFLPHNAWLGVDYFIVEIPEFLFLEVDIVIRGRGTVFMTEHPLDHGQIRAALDHFSPKARPELVRVRPDPELDPFPVDHLV